MPSHNSYLRQSFCLREKLPSSCISVPVNKLLYIMWSIRDKNRGVIVVSRSSHDMKTVTDHSERESACIFLSEMWTFGAFYVINLNKMLDKQTTAVDLRRVIVHVPSLFL